MSEETNEKQIVYHAPGSDEARKVMRDNALLYSSSGVPMASVYHVFPDWPTLDDEFFNDEDEERVAELQAIADKLKPLIDTLRWEPDVEKVESIFRQHSALLHDLRDIEVAAMLNEALSESEDFFGAAEAKVLIEALQRVDGDQYGSSVNTNYSYNDCDSYAGQHDLQITWNPDGDFYPAEIPLIFVQIHPGGDARNMASGMFYVPDNIGDEFEHLFDCLGAYETDFGTTVEIPRAFPLEQYLQDHHPETWERMYRESHQRGDKWVKEDVLHRFDFHADTCKVYLSFESYYGLSADSYRMVEPFEFGNDLWSWRPTGEIIGEMRGMWGVSATPWKKHEFQYSTGGYFEWDGPLPGTDAWNEMLEELGLEEIEPVTPEPEGQKKLAL